MAVAERFGARQRPYQPVEAALVIDRRVVGPQPFQQRDVFVEPGKVFLVADRRVAARRIDMHAHAAAAQLVERRDLARRDLRRDEPGIVLDADAEHRGGVQDIGRECRDVLAAARSSISTRSMPAASAAVAASASAAPSIRPPRPALPSTSRSEISAVNSSRIASSVASRGQSSAASRHSQSNCVRPAGSSTRPHQCAAMPAAAQWPMTPKTRAAENAMDRKKVSVRIRSCSVRCRRAVPCNRGRSSAERERNVMLTSVLHLESTKISRHCRFRFFLDFEYGFLTRHEFASMAC